MPLLSLDRRIAVLLVASLLVATPALARPVLTADQKQAAEALRSACSSDFRKLCRGVQPGGGRVLGCLETHAGDLSDQCRVALAGAADLRRAATGR